MPLLRKTTFALAEPPENLSDSSLVYQIRFSKEIFLDYRQYLRRINMYRQRIWTCKVTGKCNLTFEEALVSEKLAAEKIKTIPKHLVSPALQIIQFSMLSLKDLSTKIATELQDRILVDSELLAKKNGSLRHCRILEVVGEGMPEPQYRVVWLDAKKDVETSLVSWKDIVKKKRPLNRKIIKSFIRSSTYRSSPWVINVDLALKHNISLVPPDNLVEKFRSLNGNACGVMKKRKAEDQLNGKEETSQCSKKVKPDSGREIIKYPIEDMLVKPCPDDPIFTDRPLPSKDFVLPVCSIGDLLMVWNFCSSFSRLLNLWPFSFEEFGNSITQKDCNSNLIVEIHLAILKFLKKSNNSYTLILQKRSRKSKITTQNWTEHLSDYLELISDSDFNSYVSMIKRGHYGLLDVQGKIDILWELVHEALATDLLREKLDESIEQRHVIGATKREIALQESKKKRVDNEKINNSDEIIPTIDLNAPLIDSDENINGELPDKSAIEISKDLDPVNNDHMNGETHTTVTATENQAKSSFSDREENFRRMKNEQMEEAKKRNDEQRKQYFEREMEKLTIRINSLGKDRDYNRYWSFPRDGRLFVESSNSKSWAYYSTKEELDALLGSLNPKGERENALLVQLKKHYPKLSSEFQKRSKILAQKMALKDAVLRRSTRVRATPRDEDAQSYVNKWRTD